MRGRPLLCVAWVAATTSCMSGGDALTGLAARNPNDAGPTVVWDLYAEPFPEIPFPNDVATTPDPDSATGLRLNISRNTTTAHERKLRGIIDQLEGFGTFSPITVRFDGRIDVADFYRRQNNGDTKDDAVYLVNMNPKSAKYGQAMRLEVGRGRFPVTLEYGDSNRHVTEYFPNDPRGAASNSVFETEAEFDLNGNGVLDPFEDTDGDGVWDQPNLWGTVLNDPSRMDRYRDLITFYELETDTLVLRPVFPLEPASTYAVVITRRVIGADNASPVRSPFAAVNHIEQTLALLPLVEGGTLSKLGVGLDDVAFAWSFTTQPVADDLVALRSGLYGRGPFARFAAEFPARLTVVPQIDEPDRTNNVYVLNVDRVIEILQNPVFLSVVEFDPAVAEKMVELYSQNVAYFTMMRFESPALVENEDGVFRINRKTGEAEYGRATIYMMCVVPKTQNGLSPPFPVMMYEHGYQSARSELLGFAGTMARFGIATCGIDAYGHSLPSSDLIIGLVKAMFKEQGLVKFGEEVLKGRAKDLNGDGMTESGGGFWSANTFHTRDVVRQTELDYFQAVRVLRQFGTTTMPVDINADGQDEIAGDFNADGVPDFGGENVSYFMFGESLGGIMTSLVSALEPKIIAAAPGSGGGGLADVAIGSRLGAVVRPVFLPLVGPLLLIRQPEYGTGLEFIFHLLDVNDDRALRFAVAPDISTGSPDAIAVGDRIRFSNLDNGEFDEVTVGSPAEGLPPGLVQMHLAADYDDRAQIDLYHAGSAEPYRTINTFETNDLELKPFQAHKYKQGEPLHVLQEGFGLRRGTPQLRRLFGIAQMAIEPADPVNYASLYNDPIDLPPDGKVHKNLLSIATVGDSKVPIHTGIAFARAAGLIGVDEINPTYGKSEDDLLMDTWVVEGLEQLMRFEADACHYTDREVLFDIDETSQGLDPLQGPHLSQIVRAPFCDGSATEPEACGQCVAQPPLRAIKRHPWGVSGFRVPYVKPTGDHGFSTPDPRLPFDYPRFQANQVGWFFYTRGQEIVDDVCLATLSCPFYPGATP